MIERQEKVKIYDKTHLFLYKHFPENSAVVPCKLCISSARILQNVDFTCILQGIRTQAHKIRSIITAGRATAGHMKYDLISHQFCTHTYACNESHAFDMLLLQIIYIIITRLSSDEIQIDVDRFCYDEQSTK